MLQVVALLALILVAGCGSNSMGPSGPTAAGAAPFLLKIDPKDYKRFDEIKNSPINDRTKKQIAYLQTRGHDIKWFPDTMGTIKEHETVQLLYFDYTNYLVGFCSGAFASDNFVVSAGHCNVAVWGLDKEGASCDGNLIFAYKPAPAAKLEYYRCDRVMAHANDKSPFTRDQGSSGPEDHRTLDYTLFRLANGAGNPPLRNSFRSSREWLKKRSQTEPKDILMGLVVDPPATNKSLASAYDVVIGEAQDRHQASKDNNFTLYDSIYLKAIFNTSEGGNSGGPYYLLQENPVNAGKKLKDGIVAERIYAAPLSGSWRDNRPQYISLVTIPNFLERLLDMVDPIKP